MKSERRDGKPWLLERRAFLKLGAGFGLTSMLLGWANPAKVPLLGRAMAAGPTVASVTPRGTARNCLLVVLRGGPSHIDTFDLKVGKWTPKSFNPTQLSTGYLWPSGIMPKLAARADKFAILRALQHQEVVHERAQYFIETGRRLNISLRQEIPHIGAVIALENEEKRSSNDIFPGFMNFNPIPYTQTGNGFLSAANAPFRLAQPANGIENLAPADGLTAFDRRRATFQLLDGLGTDPTMLQNQQLSIAQSQAEKLMRDPITRETFTATSDDASRYGNNYFGYSLAVARNVFKANHGTRFIEVDHYDWDHHNGIYNDNRYSLIGLTNELDNGISALLDDLAALPGQAGGRTLLDETLVVIMGEFGRTVGALRGSGRDHYPYIFSAVLAGGGIKGGQAIGSTDSSGAGVMDFGWSQDRPMHLPDLVTTIYSALGIDWTKALTNTPSGRVFRYTDPELIGDDSTYEITPLF